MKAKLIPILVANLFAATAAVAADGDFLSGSLGIGLRSTSTSNTQDKAKLNEYRDLKDNGLIGNFDIQGRSPQYYMNLFGENLGRDDQYLDLQGGRYGVFKYQVYDDRMTHNLTWGAITPLVGAGGSNLTGTFTTLAPASNTGLWNSFDYKLKRDNFGGKFEFTNNSPWYVRVNASDTTMKGIRPLSGAMGTGSGNGFIELPGATDYKTQNVSLDAGYAVKRGQVNFSYQKSKFDNSIDQLNWRNPFFGGTDTTLLPPDNTQTKWSLNGILRQLPMGSTLSARYTETKLENSFGVASTFLQTATTGQAAVTAPTSANFNGDIKKTSGALALTSSLTDNLDSRIYWNTYEKKNHSTKIGYAASAAPNAVFAATAAPTELFGYKKDNYGIDLGYRIAKQHKLSAGYDHSKIDREERDDATETKDNTYYAEYKNTVLDNLSGKFRYQYMERRSNMYPNGPAGLVSATANLNTTIQYGTWFTAFDVANFNQDSVKLVLDWTPADFVDVGFQAILKNNDYKGRPYGQQKDDRTEYNLTVSFGDPNRFRITGFGNWETVKYEHTYRSSCTAITPAVSCDPGQPQSGATNTTTGNQFNWAAKTKDNNYVLGVGGDWAATSKLRLKVSYLYSKTTGGVDFSSTNNWGITDNGVNQPGLVPYVTDNTKKQTHNLKAIYNVNRNWEVSGGYAYEKYEYVDGQMTNGYNGGYSNYQSILNSTTTGALVMQNYLSGAFANPSYKANVVYVLGTYRF